MEASINSLKTFKNQSWRSSFLSSFIKWSYTFKVILKDLPRCIKTPTEQFTFCDFFPKIPSYFL